ncbi:MAG TPA: hypothetical protein VH276_05510 [Solirubrobacteraceae bacterium]|jgi:hypothetical protein|nr:hypothetical protein [Solirubrobacteraceae bacterium]
MRWREEGGQATVELLAVVPLVIVAALAAAAVLARAGAGERAGEAARAGAMALLQDDDPAAAARGTLAPGERRKARVAVVGRRVTVSLPAPSGLRGLVGLGPAEASADAGPEPRP